MGWQEIPFGGGQREDIEAKLAPNGVLSSVRNLREDKQGRWAKRNRYTAITPQSKHAGSDAAIPANTVLSLAELGPDRLVLMGAPARLYNYAADRNRVVPYDPDFDGKTWEPPTFAAARRTRVQTDSGNETNLPIDAATNNDYTVVATINNDYDLIAYVYSEADGGTFLFAQTLDTGTSEGEISNVQACAVGSHILVMWTATDGTGTVGLYFDYISTPNQAGLNAFTGTPTTVASGVADTLGMPALQAQDGGTSAMFVYQSGADELTVERWSSPWSSADATGTVTATQSATLHANVYSNATDNTCWVVWVEETISTDTLAAAYDDAGLASFTAAASISTDGTMNSQPTVRKYGSSSTAVHVLWNAVSSTDSQPAIHSAVVTNTPALSGSVNEIYGWHLVSNAFNSPYGTSTACYFIARPARNNIAATTALRPSYYILTTDQARWKTPPQFENIIHGRFAENEATVTTQVLAHVHASDATAGEYLFGFATLPYTLGLTASLWRFRATGYERGHAVQFGQALLYPGCITWQWDGAEPRVAGFPEPPEITGVTQGTTGNLTQSATYSWVAVYEREEANGNLALSAPSLPFTVTLSSTNDSVQVHVRPDKFKFGFGRVRLYRTLANGSVYYYVDTHITSRGWVDANLTDIDDINADTVIAANHVLYTQVGDVLPNDPPPGCRFLFRAGQRLWAGGLEDTRRARCTKEFFAGEAVSWPALEEFTIVAPDGDLLGGGSLDGVPIFFTGTTILAAIGPGPDDTGAGLFEVKEIASNAGLVEWGHRTIVECALGLLYQSPEGIYLLPRGFGTPQYVSGPVQDTLADFPYVTSAVVVEDVQEARFTVVDDLDSPTEGRMLIWDMGSRIWIVSDVDPDQTAHVAAGKWGGVHVIANAATSSNVLTESTSNQYTSGAILESQLTTGDIKLDRVMRYGRCREIQLLLEYVTPCTLTVELSVDGGATWPKSKAWELTAAAGYTVGQTVPLKWHLPIQKANRYRFRITDSAYSSFNSAGVIYHGMSLNLRPKTGGYRLRAAQRG